jgi:hypothetical protein
MPDDVIVERRGSGTEDSIVITIPSKSYNPLAPGRTPMTRPRIIVSLPIENTTSIGAI